ncbi:cytidine deaminase [Silvibacterium acidisoli]|uniref:cytidine deaminase n=1 Tax=Acidobacteriaceae bacterium ZG23-2 TaxID=2883246 RepID=UPI00406CA60C
MSGTALTDALKSQLLALARRAAEHAYAPYSGFRVGAALLLDDGTIVSGCNVENASFGLTSCAERNALFTAIGAGGATRRIIAVTVTNLNDAPSPPCGACRQVLSEFVSADAVISFPGPGGMESVPFAALFPYTFSLEKK